MYILTSVCLRATGIIIGLLSSLKIPAAEANNHSKRLM